MWRNNGIQGVAARRGSNWVWEGEKKLVGDSKTGVVWWEMCLGKGEAGSREKEAREHLGLEKKLGRAVTELAGP